MSGGDEPEDDTRQVSKHAVHPTAMERDRPYLIALAGPHVGEMYKLTKPEMVIGRDPNADVQLFDDAVSRRHAVLRCGEGDVVVEDLGSRNGILVNGQPTARVELKDGDKLQVGSSTILKFTYHDAIDDTFQRNMYESALRDGLTHAFNRRYFLDRLDNEFRFARRHSSPLSLILLDVDHFKRVNDTHGHPAGDHVLVTLAGVVQETIRTEDVFARYGGEEFAVICRAVAPINAHVLAERLRVKIAACRLELEGGVLVPVTVSLGIAGLPDFDAMDPAALIRAADIALYAAKERGRNRVELADTSLAKPKPSSRPPGTDHRNATIQLPAMTDAIVAAMRSAPKVAATGGMSVPPPKQNRGK